MCLKVLSFNLRVNTSIDGIHAWPNRKPHVFSFLNKLDADLIGFQEVTPDMYQELIENLTQYAHFGQPRDSKGEAAPIFIKKDVFRLIDQGTFWLTSTPFIESVLESSAFKRIATYVVLETTSKQRIAFFNTHFDYQNGHTIFNQAEYLYKMMLRMQNRYNAKLILTGDLNQQPSSQTIKFLSSVLETCYQRESDLGLTFHNYSHKTEGLPIDYVFFKGFELKEFHIIHHTSDIMISDHYPLYAKLK